MFNHFSTVSDFTCIFRQCRILHYLYLNELMRKIIMKKLNENTFFAKEQRYKKLKIGDKHRRQLLITLLENNNPLSIRQWSNISEVPYADARKYVRNFVKAGLISPIITAQYASRKDSVYELSKIGLMYALAISFDQKRILGNRINELRKIFQPERGISTLNHFMFNVMLNMVNHNVTDYVLRFLRDIIELTESSSEPNLWKFAQEGIMEAKPSELSALKESVLQSLNSSTDSEKNMVIKNYKSMYVRQLFDLGMRHNNTRYEKLASISEEDKDGIFMGFECRKCIKMNNYTSKWKTLF